MVDYNYFITVYEEVIIDRSYLDFMSWHEWTKRICFSE